MLLTHSIPFPSLPSLPSFLPPYPLPSSLCTLVHSMSCTLLRPQLLIIILCRVSCPVGYVHFNTCLNKSLAKATACKYTSGRGLGRDSEGGGGVVPVDTIQYAEKLIRGCNENLIIAIRGHSMHTKPCMTPPSSPSFLPSSTVAINLRRRVAACNTRSSTTSSQVK